MIRNLLLLTVLLVAGCAGTEPARQTVTVPAEAPSLNYRTDTVRVEPMPPVRGVPTLPVRRGTFEPTDAPSADVQRVTYDTQTERLSIVLAQGVQLDYAPPTYSERYDWVATSDSTGKAYVSGDPEPQDLQADVQEEPPGFWQRTFRTSRNAAALLGIALLLFISRRLWT